MSARPPLSSRSIFFVMPIPPNKSRLTGSSARWTSRSRVDPAEDGRGRSYDGRILAGTSMSEHLVSDNQSISAHLSTLQTSNPSSQTTTAVCLVSSRLILSREFVPLRVLCRQLSQVRPPVSQYPLRRSWLQAC
ncbi:hypothetical protein FS749_016303 [Ceratobasidium sp. UAMH 11750]|nr:hypothetical protein FS749_016303 [Ceratobasidium sp. UAMH 11750]